MNNPDPQLLAFTLSVNPCRYKCVDPYDQYKTLLTCLFGKKKLMLKTFSEFMFYPELNLQGNVHLHGYYKVKNKISYFRWFLPACKHFGYVLVKGPITDDWFAYIMKDSEDNAELFKPLPYPLDEDTILEYKREDWSAKHTISTSKKMDITKYFRKK